MQRRSMRSLVKGGEAIVGLQGAEDQLQEGYAGGVHVEPVRAVEAPQDGRQQRRHRPRRRPARTVGLCWKWYRIADDLQILL